MKITLEINLDNSLEVDNTIALLQTYQTNTAGASAPVAAETEKPKAKKAKAAPAKKQVEETDEENDSEFTIDDVRTKAKELIAGGNRDAVKEILEDLGVDRVTKLTAEQYGQFIGAANDIA